MLVKLGDIDLMQLSQHLFKIGIPFITPLIKTSYVAFLVLHRSQIIMFRFLILSAIGTKLPTCTLALATVVITDGLTVVIMILDAWFQLKCHSHIYYMIYIAVGIAKDFATRCSI